jgi:hypothetical protein
MYLFILFYFISHTLYLFIQLFIYLFIQLFIYQFILMQAGSYQSLIQLLESAGANRNDCDWTSKVSSWPEGVGAVVVGNQKLLHSLLHLLQHDSFVGELMFNNNISLFQVLLFSRSSCLLNSFYWYMYM